MGFALPGFGDEPFVFRRNAAGEHVHADDFCRRIGIVFGLVDDLLDFGVGGKDVEDAGDAVFDGDIDVLRDGGSELVDPDVLSLRRFRRDRRGVGISGSGCSSLLRG